MSAGAARPASGLFDAPRPVNALGDLFANVWQVCYVTPELERGMEELRDLLGVENATQVPVEGATFMKRGEEVEWEPRVAMGARGGLIIELIEPVSGEVEFYDPDPGPGPARLHRHSRTARPLDRALPAAEGRHGLLQRPYRRERVAAASRRIAEATCRLREAKFLKQR